MSPECIFIDSEAFGFKGLLAFLPSPTLFYTQSTDAFIARFHIYDSKGKTRKRDTIPFSKAFSGAKRGGKKFTGKGRKTWNQIQSSNPARTQFWAPKAPPEKEKKIRQINVEKKRRKNGRRKVCQYFDRSPGLIDVREQILEHTCFISKVISIIYRAAHALLQIQITHMNKNDSFDEKWGLEDAKPSKFGTHQNPPDRRIWFCLRNLWVQFQYCWCEKINQWSFAIGISTVVSISEPRGRWIYLFLPRSRAEFAETISMIDDDATCRNVRINIISKLRLILLEQEITLTIGNSPSHFMTILILANTKYLLFFSSCFWRISVIINSTCTFLGYIITFSRFFGFGTRYSFGISTLLWPFRVQFTRLLQGLGRND